MSGARVTTASIIGQIRSNLRDRYDNGFPVLKEIIQNSDDAKARSLVMGWCQGIEGAENPLLRDPGLFFINDAPLQLEHAHGIMTIAGGSKASDKASVGKFGLGMKSLFHMCEAFFFIASNWRQDEWAADVFNPWAERRPDWENFPESDRQAIEARLNPVIDKFTNRGEPNWFVVWVPLRTLEQVEAWGNQSIIANFEASEGTVPPEFMLEPSLTDKVADIFPLLKCLERVELVIEHNSDFVSRFLVELQKGAARSQFTGEKAFENDKASQSWDGHVQISSAGQTSTLSYAGVETLLTFESLNELKHEERGWPTSLDGETVDDVPDKAEQHASVVITRTPAIGNAVITASWAVFLPLDATREFQKVEIDGNFDYHIYLHGYFFVDAGRKGIHGHDDIGEDADFSAVGNDEKLLRRAWNLTLANKGTLNQLLPALKGLLEALGVKKDKEIEAISLGIQSLFPNKYLQCATSRYGWLYRLLPAKKGWELIEGTQGTRLLPAPENRDDYSRVWETFPWLSAHSENVYFAESGKGHIVSSENAVWMHDELDQLLRVDVQDVFTSQVRLGYLLSFIKQEFDIRGKDRLPTQLHLQALLCEIVKAALTQVPLESLAKHRKLFSDLVGYIPQSKRLSISIDKKSGQPLWDVIAAQNTSHIFLPADFDNRVAPGLASFDESCASTLLRALDDWLHKRKTRYDWVEQSDSVIREILEKTPNRKVVYSMCGDLRLFPVYDLRRKKDRLKSRNELVDLRENGRLFLMTGHKNVHSSFGIGRELLNAIAGDVHFLGNNTKKLLFPDTKLPDCNPHSTLSFLASHPDLAIEERRIALIQRLLSEDLEKFESRQGFRYLLHGCCEDNGSKQLWKNAAHEDAVWIKLWAWLTADDQPKWTIISSELSEELNDRIKKALKIHDVSAETVLSTWGSRLVEIDYAPLALTQDDRNAILCKVRDGDLWCSLPLHETSDGKYQKIDGRCVLEGADEIPEGLDVVAIKQSSHEDVKNQQLNFIGQIDHEKLIRIALKQEIPQQHGLFILDQLMSIRHAGSSLSDETLDSLKHVSWLTLANGQAVSPSRVISFAKDEWPEAVALCEHVDTGCFS
ncbi:sacsin N-terminal ATP-binding-like domain-containing protein, partial [Sansalvadorimonas verongulae]|uniref:sacsin N-terminal ATP-binding-like domain-containing protein n=1 Tax=Sansalvadorimonas verongulae TaxID=2172824 RepID=UPI0012BBA004